MLKNKDRQSEFLFVRSEAKAKKEASMNSNFSQHFEEELKKYGKFYSQKRRH